MELCQDRRGTFVDMQYIDADRVDLHYVLPLAEIIYDFFDTLKSRTRGYASFDYELKEYVQSNLVKLDIMLNGEVVDALGKYILAHSLYGFSCNNFTADASLNRYFKELSRNLFL